MDGVRGSSGIRNLKGGLGGEREDHGIHMA